MKVETEKKQKKLEKEALKKYEAEQKAEEAKRATEEAKGGKPQGKPAKAAPKKGKDADKPVVDVPQLTVPEVTPFQSEMGNEYIRERPLEEIVEKMMQPTVEEEERLKRRKTIKILTRSSLPETPPQKISKTRRELSSSIRQRWSAHRMIQS